MEIGVQMYSLREYVKTRGLEKMLADIKNCGCDCIEPICDDYGIGYEKVGKLMRENGLHARSMHIQLKDILDKERLKMLRDVFELETAVVPWMSEEEFFDEENRNEALKKALENAQSLGMTLAYHNHNQEFKEAGALSSLPEKIPGLKLQPDIFWVKAAGHNPLDFVRDNIKNIGLLHIKEFGENVDAAAPVVGDGKTNAKEVLKFAKSNGCKLAILEYEKPCCDDIAYIEKSIRFMREALK